MRLDAEFSHALRSRRRLCSCRLFLPHRGRRLPICLSAIQTAPSMRQKKAAGTESASTAQRVTEFSI